jgi:hypothetical protein
LHRIARCIHCIIARNNGFEALGFAAIAKCGMQERAGGEGFANPRANSRYKIGAHASLLTTKK